MVAAAIHCGWERPKHHFAKAKAADRLHEELSLPAVRDLLVELNTARKAYAYGDIEWSGLDAEAVASEVESYVDAVGVLVGEV